MNVRLSLRIVSDRDIIAQKETETTVFMPVETETAESRRPSPVYGVPLMTAGMHIYAPLGRYEGLFLPNNVSSDDTRGFVERQSETLSEHDQRLLNEAYDDLRNGDILSDEELDRFLSEP
jgi:hypothetical protein